MKIEKIFVGWFQNDELIKEDTLLVSDAFSSFNRYIKFTIKGAKGQMVITVLKVMTKN